MTEEADMLRSRSPYEFRGRLRLAITLCGAWSLVACEVQGPSGIVTVRDSAGVEIVESSEREWAEGAAWTVDSAPLLDLTTSGDTEAHEFYRVGDGILLPDGDIAIAVGAEVRFFSPLGAHLGTVGRAGQGPGEFERLSRLELFAPDSLVAVDYWQRRATIFGPERELARVVGLDVNFMRRNRFAVLGHTFVVMKSWPSVLVDDAPFGLVRTPVPIVGVSAEGHVTDTLTVVAGSESVRLQGEEGIADARALFGRDSHLSTHGGRIIVGDAIDFEYQILSADGTVERIVRGDYDLQLGQDMLEAEIAATLGDDPSPAGRRFMAELPVPEFRPAYMNMQVDPTGSVWLEEHVGGSVRRTSGDPAIWEVFATTGGWLGQVLLPPRFTVFEIGEDYILGVHRDELDVEHVQVLTLRR